MFKYKERRDVFFQWQVTTLLSKQTKQISYSEYASPTLTGYKNLWQSGRRRRKKRKEKKGKHLHQEGK